MKIRCGPAAVTGDVSRNDATGLIPGRRGKQVIQEPEDLPESQTLEAVLNFLVDLGKGDMNACVGRVVGYDPDFRMEVGDFFCKAISNQPSAVSLNQKPNH